MLVKTGLIREIERGLHKSWLMAFQTNDTPYVSMKPEYLTTIMLGQSLSKWLSDDHSGAKCRVRFEERTQDVATRAFRCMPPPYKPRNVHGRKKEGGEEGSVDHFTLHIYASIAEQERKMISERVRAATFNRQESGKEIRTAITPQVLA